MTHRHPEPRDGWIEAAALGLAFTRFRRLDFRKGVKQVLETTRTEMCLVALSGTLDMELRRAGTACITEAIGPLDMLLIPPRARVTLSSPAGRIVAYEAPSEQGADYAVIRFDSVDAAAATHRTYGNSATGCRRQVWHCVDAGQRCSRLMVGICEGEAGGWTAWPPHEHGPEREELYYYFDMGHSFGLQCVYEELGDPGAAAIVRDGDLVAIDKGYHPNVGAPAGRIKYIYCMTSRVPGQRDFMKLRLQPGYGDSFV